MVRKVLIAIAAVVVLFLIVVSTRPDSFHIERSANIPAPMPTVFAQVDDFHNWAAWSPWEKLDPAMKKTFAGAQYGEGAVYSWVGNDKTGEGRMTLEKSVAPSSISIKLEFFKPFAATNQSGFSFVPDGSSTKVTWSMDGKNNFMAKAAGLFMNMDQLVGGDFEKGLANLSTVAQAQAKADAEAKAKADAAAKAEADAKMKADAEAAEKARAEEEAAAKAKKGKKKK
jgi:Polyketide cyclase / dehydrase and lipid transport